MNLVHQRDAVSEVSARGAFPSLDTPLEKGEAPTARGLSGYVGKLSEESEPFEMLFDEVRLSLIRKTTPRRRSQRRGTATAVGAPPPPLTKGEFSSG
jgi:hypothetical protein